MRKCCMAMILFVIVIVINTGCNIQSGGSLDNTHDEITNESELEITNSISNLDESKEGQNTTSSKYDDVISEYIKKLYEEKMDHIQGDVIYSKHIILKIVSNESEMLCYLMPWCSKFNIKPDEKLELTGSNGIVCRLTLTVSENGDYEVTDYWEPRDGALFSDDLKKNFPEEIQNNAINSVSLYANSLQNEILDEIGYNK